MVRWIKSPAMGRQRSSQPKRAALRRQYSSQRLWMPEVKRLGVFGGGGLRLGRDGKRRSTWRRALDVAFERHRILGFELPQTIDHALSLVGPAEVVIGQA